MLQIYQHLRCYKYLLQIAFIALLSLAVGDFSTILCALNFQAYVFIINFKERKGLQQSWTNAIFFFFYAVLWNQTEKSNQYGMKHAMRSDFLNGLQNPITQEKKCIRRSKNLLVWTSLKQQALLYLTDTLFITFSHWYSILFSFIEPTLRCFHSRTK